MSLSGLLIKTNTEQNTSHKMDELASRIQNLPTEIYDCILDFKLATPSTITIDTTYKPPACLQLNHKLRNIYISQYYGSKTVFTFENGEVAEKWVESLSPAARETVRNIHFKRTYGRRNNGHAGLRGLRDLQEFERRLEYSGLNMAEVRFRTNCKAEGNSEEQWLDNEELFAV